MKHAWSKVSVEARMKPGCCSHSDMSNTAGFVRFHMHCWVQDGHLTAATTLPHQLPWLFQ